MSDSSPSKKRQDEIFTHILNNYKILTISEMRFYLNDLVRTSIRASNVIDLSNNDGGDNNLERIDKETIIVIDTSEKPENKVFIDLDEKYHKITYYILKIYNLKIPEYDKLMRITKICKLFRDWLPISIMPDNFIIDFLTYADMYNGIELDEERDCQFFKVNY